MDCDDAEEARDLLRDKNSVVTRTVYRAHFNDRRRAPPPSSGDVLPLRRARSRSHPPRVPPQGLARGAGWDLPQSSCVRCIATVLDAYTRATERPW